MGITLADVKRWKREGNAGKLSGLLTSIFPASDEVVEEAANALCELGEADALARVAKSWSASDKQRSAGAGALRKVHDREEGEALKKPPKEKKANKRAANS
jgi:hypothetical protein